MDVRVGLIFLFLGLCAAQPVQENDNCCIVVTPERAKEFNQIGEEVNEFINKLADKYEDIDFRFVELKVDRHYDIDEEDNDKETTIKISVNACNTDSGKKIEKDRYFKNDDDETKKSEDDEDSVKIREQENQSERCEREGKDDEMDAIDATTQDKTEEERDENRDSKNSKKYIKINEFKKRLNRTKQNIKKSKPVEGGRAMQSGETNSKERTGHDVPSDKQKVSKNTKKMNRFPFSKNKDLDNDAEKVNVHKNNNYNGDYDNSNIYIYAPKFDNSRYVLGNNDYLNSYIYDILSNKVQKKDTKADYCDCSPGACDNGYYFPPDDNYFNAYTIDQVFKDVMMNKFKKDDQNGKYYLNFGEYAGTADFDKNIYTGTADTSTKMPVPKASI